MTSSSHTIVALPGDGIGREVTAAALQVMENRALAHKIDLDIQEYSVGGAGLDKHGEPLPAQVVEACRNSDAVFLGAVGDSRFDGNPPHRRPEEAILGLRRELGLFANLRPIKISSALTSASTLKSEVLEGVDILFVRELTGGIYFGEPRGCEVRDGRRVAFDSEVYWDWEIERIAHLAFKAALGREKRLTSVDKSNVLESSRLWRKVVQEVHESYPEVELVHVLVDNCAMQLVRDPGRFDVILTSNMFGDILSDEAAMLTGSLGMLTSASLGAPPADGQPPLGLFEPVHGSAPDIAGQDLANPLAAVGSCALLFRHGLGRDDIAIEIEAAVEGALSAGWRTPDIAQAGTKALGTREMTAKILSALS